MPFNPGPFDLNATGLVLSPQAKAVPKAVTPDFYRELDAEFDGFAGHLLISQHRFEEAWPAWEMHPKGDEVVYLIDGDVDFVLWIGDGEQTLRVHEPGSYVVVPRA